MRSIQDSVYGYIGGQSNGNVILNSEYVKERRLGRIRARLMANLSPDCRTTLTGWSNELANSRITLGQGPTGTHGLLLDKDSNPINFSLPGDEMETRSHWGQPPSPHFPYRFGKNGEVVRVDGMQSESAVEENLIGMNVENFNTENSLPMYTLQGQDTPANLEVDIGSRASGGKKIVLFSIA